MGEKEKKRYKMFLTLLEMRNKWTINPFKEIFIDDTIKELRKEIIKTNPEAALKGDLIQCLDSRIAFLEPCGQEPGSLLQWGRQWLEQLKEIICLL